MAITRAKPTFGSAFGTSFAERLAATATLAAGIVQARGATSPEAISDAYREATLVISEAISRAFEPSVPEEKGFDPESGVFLTEVED